MKKKNILAWAAAVISIAALGACGDDGPETMASAGFLRGPLPSEQTLCQLEMGVATVAQARTLLGEPTDVLSFTDQTNVAYYWGSAVDLRASLILNFDEQGHMASASLQNIGYPQCWRAQLAALEASDAAGRN